MLQEIYDSLEPDAADAETEVESFVAPTSFAQRRFWLLDALSPGRATYNVPLGVRLHGPVRAATLAAALAEVVARHETLRTAFAEEGGEPVQVIAPALAVPLPQVDLAALPAGLREDELRRQVQREAERPFDLRRAPLLRALLFRLGAGEHALFLNQHHIVTDAWSLGLLLAELLAIDGALRAGRPLALPEPPIQYADFAAWQREQLQGAALERKLAPWRRRLAGAPVELPLAPDHPRRTADGAGGFLAVALPAALVERLAPLAREGGATLFMALLAAFQALLFRHGGRTDLVVGSPVAGRGRVETEGVIGCFVNTLALRVRLDGAVSFRELLGRVREVVVEAFAGDDLPFEKLVEELCPERRRHENPLFQVAFAFQQPPVRGMALAEIRLEPMEIHSGTAKFDLSLNLTESPAGIAGFWEHAASLFDPATVARLSEHWRTLLADAAGHPGRPLAALALLSAAESHQLAAEWNDSRAAYPRAETIAGLFAAQAARRPEAPALVSAAGTATYGELAARSRRLARRLAAAGVVPDALVGVFLERGAEMVTAWLAALTAGGAYLPLDPDYPAERLAFMLADGKVRALVTTRELATRLPGADDAAVILIDELDEADGAGPPPASGATPDNLAYVVYTSGSTGVPKGVAVPQRAVVRLVRDSDYVRLTADDRIAQASNASFDAATFEVWGALLNGGRLVAVERDVTLSPEDFSRFLREQGITALFLTTALFNRLASLDPDAFAGVRHLIVGGDAVDPTRAAEVLAAAPPERLLNGYGPTEGTTFTTWHHIRAAAGDPTVPIGRPLANTTVTLLDADLRPVPAGVAGELHLGGDGLARGYFGRPDLTAERFVPRPLPLGEDALPGGRLYRTGDLARLRPDGVLEFLGRLDAQVKIRGFRVEPAEVEAALAAHPAVGEAAVVARPNAAGELALVAWFAPRRAPGPAAPTPRELRDFLAGRLPEPMLPAAFVEVAALPRTPNGKVDRAALPDPGDTAEVAGWEPPRTPVEEVLAGLWADVLRISPPRRVGARDNFFDLGGHSLTATAMTSLARSTFRVELPARALFERPTLAELAEHVEALLQADEGVELPPIIPQPHAGDPPLSFAQQRLWFLDELAGGESPFYNIAAALSLTGRLDAAALERSIDAIVGRHEALRTTFRPGPEGRPAQVIHPHRPFQVPVADLRALPPAARAAEAFRQARLGIARPFSLTRGPLLRVELLRVEDEQHALLLSMHHIVSDGWSLEVMIRELVALYTAFAAGLPSPLPVLPVQYADFALWQRRWLGGAPLDGQLAYWRRQLAGAPLVFELATDRPRPAVQTYDGGSVVVHLPGPLAERLQGLARAHRVTLFMALLAAFAALLERHTGRRDVLVGTPIANRNRAETAGLIGFFVNMLVLRADLAGDPGFDRLLARVREMALGAYAHQDLPFERLVEDLQPARDLSRSPIFQVCFAMSSTPWHALDLPGLTLGFLDSGAAVELYDLTLQIADTGQGFDARLSFNADLFDAATIARLGGHLEALLASLAENPRRPAAEVEILAAAERRQLLAEWSGVRPAPAPPLPVHALFAAQARLRPAAPALVWKGGEISYEELDRRANRLAHHLRARGVEREGIVALHLEGTLDFAAAALAVWKAGGAFLPLDPRWPRERLAWALADSRARALVTRTALPGGHALPIVDLDAGREAIAAESSEDPGVEVDPAQLAYVIYTSGSTGEPKGVAVGHQAFSLHAQEMARLAAIGPGDRALQASSFAADMSLEQVFPPLLAGAAVLPWHPEVAGVPELVRDLRGSGVTMIDLPTALWHQAATEWAQGHSRPDLPALRWTITGGEAIPPDALALWRRTPLGHVPLVNGYGPTEATVTTALFVATPDEADPRFLARLPIGRPVAPHAVYLLDDRGALVPPGAVGELCVGGPALARGYLGRPEATAAAFVPDPFSGVPGARLYRTGDLARFLPDGNLDFAGRRDAQMKLLGYRIEPGEIETALARHPQVRAAAVAVVEGAGSDPSPNRRTLAAWVVGAPGGAPAAAELRAFLQEKLPPHMVPASFTPVAELPLTTSGKVDRDALARSGPRPEAQEAAETAAVESVEAIGAIGAIEAKVIELWKEVLGIDEVGPDDNFFDLGGHSMLVAWVRASLQESFGVDLEMVELFNYPTARALAERIRQEVGAAAPEPDIVEIQPEIQPAPVAAPVEPAVQPAVPTAAEIAIVGWAGRFPGARDVGELWRNLRDGVESISFFEPGWTPPEGGFYRVPAHGLLEGADLFDAPFFGYSPREAELMDPQQRLFLEAAWEALENAGYTPESLQGGSGVGVFGGASKNDYLARLIDAGVMREPVGSQLSSLGNDRDNLTLRVSYKLDLEGPSFNVQTTCSTSLVAVHLAAQSLLAGECDLALAGGVSVGGNSRDGYFYRPGDVLSPDGHCRAFDARAAGSVDADGVAIVVLKRLADALAAGDTLHAVIKGSGINNDGAGKVGFMAPRMASQSRLVRTVLDRAAVPPETVTYVEAHGTATALGDPIEVTALTAAFRAGTPGNPGTDRRGFCALGSLKTNIGHTNSASGASGLIKAALALEHRQIPPTLHFETPNPEIDLAASPFFVNTRLLDWEVPAGTPRRAAINSFGVGGTNAHVVLEEAPAASPRNPLQPEIPASHPWRLLTLSARSAAALDVATANLALHLERHPALSLDDVAFTLQVGRRAFDHRRAVLCRDLDEGAATLGLLDAGRTATGLATRRAAAVFLFPGQGAQTPGAGAGLYEAEPVFREEIDRCADLLLPHLGRDVREVLFNPEAAGLDRTEATQPALFALEWALARTWMAWGVTPQAMLGHSLGEYVAATLAGVFALPDALALVAARGRLIGSLPGGAMLAVPLPAAELAPLLDGGLALAAVNGPSRSVLSGPEEAVAALQDRLARRGVAGRRLAVSHAFHSAMMDPILPVFAAEVRKLELRPTTIPFLSNLTGRWIQPGEATDPDYWVRHLRGTVRFADGMAELLEDPARVFLEVGPGRTLANAARQGRAGKAPVTALPSLPQPTETVLPEPAWALLTLGRLWTEGIAVDWSALNGTGHRVPLPTYPFERRRFWVDTPQAAPLATAAAVPAPAADPRRAEDPADWFYVPFWRPALPAGAGEGPAGPRLVFLDDQGLGRRVEGLLLEAGTEVLTVSPGAEFAREGERAYRLRPGRGEDYDALIADLKARDRLPAEVVHLWNVGPAADTDAARTTAFDSPLLLAQALAREASRQIRVLLVSTGVHAVTGREAMQPEKALLLGPCRSMPQRFPGLACRAVDVELPALESDQDELVLLLAAEMASAGDDTVVAYRDRRRWVQDFAPQRLEAAGPVDRFRQEGVYLVTGGMGGIGSTLLTVLWERCRARLVVVGRSIPPSSEAREAWLSTHPEDDPLSRRLRRLRSLEARGAEILALPADVTDPAALREVRRQAEERFGAVHGIVHAAGAAGPAMIDWRKPEAADEAFAAKVGGTLALAEAFRGAPLDLFVLCSSLSSLLGGMGQVGYAASNAFLDAFAWSRSADPRTLTLSIDWDLWRDVGFEAESQGAHQNRRRAASGLTSRQGAEVFQHALGYGFPQIAVSQIDVRELMAASRSWETSGFRSARREEAALSPADAAPAAPSSATTAAAADGDFADDVEAAIAAVWRELLGVREVGPQDNFFALGGDSLIALGLTARLHDRFRVELSPSHVYEAATLGELAGVVRGLLAPVEA
jgi:amino acid adenylation domain-containing protein